MIFMDPMSLRLDGFNLVKNIIEIFVLNFFLSLGKPSKKSIESVSMLIPRGGGGTMGHIIA